MRLLSGVVIFASCILCLVFTGGAQVPYLLTHLDNTMGLSNNRVRDVFQDSDRLLWISTSDGLNVYNGSSFQLFKSYDLSSSFSLQDNVITDVNEDKRKQIWICTEKGVTRYNKDNGSLHHYFYNVDQKDHPGSADYFLTIDKTGLVVAGLRLDSILYVYDYNKDTFIPIKFDTSIGMVAEVEFDDEGRLWTLSKGGTLRVFARNSNVFHLLRSFSESSGIHLFHIANHHIFFVNGYRELQDVTNLQPKKLASLPRLVNSISFFRGHYFISYINNGLQEFDTSFLPVQNLLKYYPTLNNLEIRSLLTTGKNVLWLSTSDHGLYKIVSNQNNFGTVNDATADTPGTMSITAFAQVNDELWAGTVGKGIIRYKNFDSPGMTTTTVNPDHAFYDFAFNQYNTIQKGYDNNFYIGSEAQGVTIYDPVRKQFTPWGNVKGVSFNADFFRVFTILPCRDSSIFLGYLHGFMHLKVSKDKAGNFSLVYLKEYKNDQRFLNMGNNSVSSMIQKDNWILMGYQFGGLVLMDESSGHSISILHQNYHESLTSNNITSMFVDTKGYLWVGTDFGLNRIKFDQLFYKNPRFQKINVENGLSDNTIHGIIEDNQGAIWVSTNKGLAKINANTFKIIQYRAQDGLQNDEFNDGAIYKDESGKLYFGGIAGFNHFDPQKISVDTNLPNLLISDLTFGDKVTSGIRLMVLKPGQNDNQRVYKADPNQNFFHLKIEAANGFSNMKFQYKYLLQNYDKRWRDLSENSRIEYSNLPAGDYVFLVRWSNGEGNWTNEKVVFHLTVDEYLWLTAYAKAIYLLIISTIVYVIFRMRRNRIEDKNKLFVENLVRMNEQKLYQEKVNFFTNITHELQTPLTLILGSIERYNNQGNEAEKKEDNQKFLKIANQEAFRLQYLVHQLLEFRKAESGHAKVVYNFFNASNLIKNIAELFGPLRDQKALNFELSLESNVLLRSDKDKFEKIIFNLFSNAFKHSGINESIRCKAESIEGKDIRIEISNSGFDAGGIELSVLFEQFYTIDQNKNTKESSGIGLALTKQLTEVLGGTISVAAAEQWITFTLTLPLNLTDNAVAENGQMSSDKPSYLVRSIAETMEVPENSITKKNDLALMENLEVPGKKSVLIVEDDVNIRLLLSELLQEKYVVYEAENGENAVDILKKIIPNLILSDVLMSDMDGLTLCSKVKNNMATCHIPFLLLSARNSPEEKLEGFEAGADGYLTKPYNPASLLKKITELIDYRENILSFLNKDQYYQSVSHNGLKPEDQNFLNGVIRVVSENLSNAELDAAHLEKELALSRMSLYRRLMALTNMTPSEFIKNYRLRQAAALLKSTNLTVSEIYYQTGFNNQSYFYREFKKLYHSSPKEYRELNQLDVAH